MVDATGSVTEETFRQALDASIQLRRIDSRCVTDAGVWFFGAKEDEKLILSETAPKPRLVRSPIPEAVDAGLQLASGGLLVVLTDGCNSRVTNLEIDDPRIEWVRLKKNSDTLCATQMEIGAHVVADAQVAQEIKDRVDRWCSWCPPPCERLPPPAVMVGLNSSFRCSGVVIGPDMVLTAAHCLPANVVGVGSQLSSVRRIPVASSEVAPDGLDVALLKTAGGLRPASELVLSKKEPSGPVLSVGFGAASFGSKHVVSGSARGWGCGSRQAQETGCRPGRELFIPGSPGHDTCAGDSGGPVFASLVPREDCSPGESVVEGRWRLLGITSRSGEGASVACGQGSVVTRADVLVDWLRGLGLLSVEVLP